VVYTGLPGPAGPPGPAGGSLEGVTYITGAWVPILEIGGVAQTATANGYFWRLGDMVAFQGLCTITNNPVGTGNVFISGFPYLPRTFPSGITAFCHVNWYDMLTAFVKMHGTMASPSPEKMSVNGLAAAGLSGGVTLTHAAFKALSRLNFSGFYPTDDPA